MNSKRILNFTNTNKTQQRVEAIPQQIRGLLLLYRLCLEWKTESKKRCMSKMLLII